MFKLFSNFSVIRYNEALIDSEEAQKIVEYVTKVKGIRDVLSRDHMKVAFFGRFVTSVKK